MLAPESAVVPLPVCTRFTTLEVVVLFAMTELMDKALIGSQL